MTSTPAVPGVTLRLATPGDLSAVEQLLVASGLPTDGVSEALCSFVVAESETRLVGVVGLEVCGEHGLLRSTAVAPEWRDRGLGRQLVERIIAEAESRGIHALYLLTTTAERYFPSFGFVTTTRDAVPAPVRETAEFKTACPASATVMCLTLPRPISVLFLCTGNSARSQIAEAILTTRGTGRFHVGSAGVRPAAKVNPHAVAVLNEYGIDWTGRSPKSVDEVLGQSWDFIITVCDRAKESCPIFPGRPMFAHWGMEDPAEVQGDEGTKRAAFRLTALHLARRIDLLLALPIETLERRAREERVRFIGTVGARETDDAPTHVEG